MLIGLDFYFSFVTGKIRKGLLGPVAVHTNVGWVLSGSYTKPVVESREPELFVQTGTVHTLTLNIIPDEKAETLSNVMNKFWYIDNLGVNGEIEVLQNFENEISFNGTRYVVKLPIKPHHNYLLDNYMLVVRCLKILRPSYTSISLWYPSITQLSISMFKMGS